MPVEAIGPLIFFFIFFAVIVPIVAGIVKQVKDSLAKEQSVSEQPQKTHTINKDLLERLEKAKAAKAAQSQSQMVSSLANYKTNINSTLDFNYSTLDDDHSHTPNSDTEYLYETVEIGGSIGGESSEYCDDMRNVRIIAKDKVYDNLADHEEFEKMELQGLIAYGQAINAPAFKKRYIIKR